ncbi:MAG: CoA-binding protein [Chloroflexia bacterium]|nr:CoA-binding protein [Chloroflexia bacterium]
MPIDAIPKSATPPSSPTPEAAPPSPTREAAKPQSPERSDGGVIPSAGAFERLRILLGAKTIAIVGLSADPMRPSHFAAIYMQSEGYDIVPVNPRYAGGEILGQKVFASLAEIDRPVDIVDVFRKPAEAPALAEEAAAIGAKTLWLQLGVENDEAGEIAREHGLAFVQNRCVKIEHARFFGGLNLVGMNTGVITARRRLQ